MPPLFPNFLSDENEYGRAEVYWKHLWEQIPAFNRDSWHSEWFKPSLPKDGNPIFTAVSEKFGKAIRVIQYEATTNPPEIDFWLDTFGGSNIEPVAIRELVIACALSDESARRASQLMSSWIIGDIEIASDPHDHRGTSSVRASLPRWRLPNPDSQAI
jgi:hypothetical protein